MFEVVGGARYLSIETIIDANIGPIARGIDETDTVWDGFVGLAGRTELNHKWALTYYADIGGGGSDRFIYTAFDESAAGAGDTINDFVVGEDLIDLGGRPARDFARERADRQINLFEAITEHLNALKGQGQSPIITVHGQGAADRLAQVLVDHALEPPLRIERLESALGVPVVAVGTLGEALAVLGAG